MLQGTYSYVLQDENGQIALTHSVSAGLDYASIGPEHAALHDSGRAEYVSQDDAAALDAVVRLARTEGILPALESAHAVAEALRIAPAMAARDILVVNLSGRGDKDMGILAREFAIYKWAYSKARSYFAMTYFGPVAQEPLNGGQGSPTFDLAVGFAVLALTWVGFFRRHNRKRTIVWIAIGH